MEDRFMVTLSASARRVPEHTAEQVNRAIQQQTLGNIALYATHTEDIGRRLEELDQEWDVERALETAASSFTLLGLGLGTFVHRRWYLFPAVVAGFLLQHALQGWCPPLSVIRRMGFRTRREIDVERYALKILRGDFKELASDGKDTEKLLEVIEN
jgi:hypothetical protein